MFTLEGKKAFITGGTSGIGRGIAACFVKAGAQVVIAGRSVKGEAVGKDIGAGFVRCDVSVEAQVIDALDQSEKILGTLDIVVLNAGIAHDTQGLEHTPTEVMREIIEINLMGVYYGLKYAPRHMNDNGSIITTGSTAGSGLTTIGYGEYSASKAGVAYLTRTVAIEQSGRGIRANTVSPASIGGTGMMPEDDGSSVPTFYKTITALDRMGTIDEVVSAYLYLASDASSFITGQELRVDGGMTAGIGAPIHALVSAKAGL